MPPHPVCSNVLQENNKKKGGRKAFRNLSETSCTFSSLINILDVVDFYTSLSYVREYTFELKYLVNIVLFFDFFYLRPTS
jgi:hypothetical protein